ncbi:uncharacterized protein LOC127244464 [Andrographis paniculata]|uniref:uncharacterized protein LOC127244464 n=1 Tax=Andrographis paniculata TaxID=175694 RepID=UPI0021E762CB|nr:uncharacterized protein LOC127244464 [Andrographis paniculata]
MAGGEGRNWWVLNRLKKAVKKIIVLLDFDTTRFKLASLIGARRSRLSSFDSRRLGLTAVVVSDEDDGGDEQSSTRRRSNSLQRTSSYPLDDVDKRADAFIANFYKQLKYERQISLQLRYTQARGGNSFGSQPSP